jgi:5-methylcytosine-specific restriction protein A
MDRPSLAIEVAPVEVQTRRASAADRGYDRRWARIADREIAADPFCAKCGRTFPRRDLVRDHIVPHRGDPKLFEDPDNRQTLCRWCHAAKSAAEGTSRG